MFSEAAVHKIVPLRFAGADLKFKTSHALFSAHHVDDGTMLLLKTLAQRQVIPDTGRVLDAGCGYGPLSLAVKKHRPALEVTARDRLVLAAEFTAENARLNGLAVDAAPGLLLEGVEGPFDLILSNVPAKAGEPVLADFAVRSLALVAPQGLVAVVVVEPLAPWFEAELGRAGAEVLYTETGPGYRVYHYRRPSSVPAASLEAPFPAAYRRGKVTWEAGPRRLTHETFYGLPNFDGLDFRLQATVPALEKLKLAPGDVLVWEPVQGHLAAWADAAAGPGASLHLAGNDALGLAAGAAAVTRRAPLVHPAATLADLDLGPGSVAAALVQFHSEPEVPWVGPSLEALLRLLAPGAVLVANGSSTDLTRFLEKHRGLRLVNDRRVKGWRAVTMVRQSSLST